MKVKALSAEAKSSAAVLASLPPGVMFMTYASFARLHLSAIHHTSWQLADVGWGLLDALRHFVMRKMINFKF